jgi:Mrp family chromosome partitioning ATPase
MPPRTSVAMLFTRLRLNLPDLRSILVASPRSSVNVSALATELAESAADWGLSVTLIDVQDRPATHHKVGTRSRSTHLEAELHGEAAEPPGSSVERISARPFPEAKEDSLGQVLGRPDRFFVVLGSGLLDSPATLLAIPQVDAVLIAVRRGKTARSDLQDCRVEIERAGGKLAGAVLLS